jgi:TPR repeat protein
MALFTALGIAATPPASEAALPLSSGLLWRGGPLPTSSSTADRAAQERGGVVQAFDRHFAALDFRRSARSAATVGEADMDLPLLEREPQFVLAAAEQGGLSPAEDLQAACNAGDANSCSMLGTSYSMGVVGSTRVEKDPARAAELYRQGCGGGDPAGCYFLGDVYSRGEGVAKDLVRAVELFWQACDAGIFASCWQLGDLYLRGEGVAKDLARAAQLYLMACDGGNPWGCEGLGNLYNRGDGVVKDATRAAALYQQACDGGNPSGCNSVGILYEKGEGVAKDIARAAELYRQACDRLMEVDGACKNLSRVNQALQAGAAPVALAARKDQLRLEMAQMVDAWLAPSGVIVNVADAMQHDRLKTMAQLAAGKRIRVTVTPPSFSDGRFVIHNSVSAFNVDQAAGETGFSWDRWFQMTQNFGQGVYTVVCRFTPDQAGSLTEGTSIVVEATLIAAGTNDIVLDCAL